MLVWVFALADLALQSSSVAPYPAYASRTELSDHRGALGQPQGAMQVHVVFKQSRLAKHHMDELCQHNMHFMCL